ncbi:hypothetical protein ACFWP7_37790 [Streptomyces sp. NPDC058470]|uniref:hypothetical protein n=1 Tax=Streptomyces sp. NPDC058470 TaxID=3346515 RepID=UPI0036473F76
MYVRIITEAKPSLRLLDEDEDESAKESRLRLRSSVIPTPWLALAGVEDDPAEQHIVRGID